MLIQGNEVNHNCTYNTEICIIGSGAAGAILAWELSEMRHSVVLLEKGGYFPKEKLTQREDEMVPLLFKNAGFQFAIPSGIAIAQGNCVGGSTVINDAVCFRTPDDVLYEWAGKYKINNITPSCMEPYFEKVEKRISVSEVRPFEINKNNLMLKKGSEKLGWASGPNKRNCKNCRLCGLCHLGCYYGTKQSMLETYIKDIEDRHTDIVTIYADCTADRIIKSGNRITGVIGRITSKNGHVFEINIKPKVLIICAGTIASSEILLRNKLDPHGQVGKKIALHPSPAIIGDFDDVINGNEGIPMAYHCHEFSILNTKRSLGSDQYPSKRGYMIESVFLPPCQFTLPLSAFPEFRSKEIMKRYDHYAMAGILLQDEPVGQIMLGGPFGTIIYYELSKDDSRNMIDGMKNTCKIFFKAGASRVITSHKLETVLNSVDELNLIDDRGVRANDIYLGSGHPQGGNRMGGDDYSSVVNSDCRFHGIENLYVCDASVFPTSVGVNPQLTVMALATRTAEIINEQVKGIRPL